MSDITTTPMQNQDYSALANLATLLTNNVDKYSQMFSDQQTNIAKSREDYSALMKRLLDKEDSASTGNPFTDMLNGYIRMKKRNDPNYQWEGLLGSLFKKKTAPQVPIVTAQQSIGPMYNPLPPQYNLPLYEDRQLPRQTY